MKSKSFLLVAAFVAGHTAFAQSPSTSTTTTSVDPAGATTTNSATVAIPAANSTGVQPEIKYFAIMHGAGLDFSGAHEATINSSSQLTYEQRIKLLAATSQNVEVGVEARVMTNFGNGANTNITNGAWRLVSVFKHVYQDSFFDLTLIPRVVLPTSSLYQNQKVTPSPDMVFNIDMTPKNSRFSFYTGLEFMPLFHSAGAMGGDYMNADTLDIGAWVGTSYQLTEKTALTASYWPSWAMQGHRGASLTDAWAQDGGNEIDIGAAYEFSKGWTVNPYLATEMSGISNQAAIKNMQLNFNISGRFL